MLGILENDPAFSNAAGGLTAWSDEVRESTLQAILMASTRIDRNFYLRG